MTPAEVAGRLERLRSTLVPAIVAELTETGLDAQARAKLNATSRPRVRSGRLRSSIATGTEVTSTGAAVHLFAGGPAVRYAWMQDQGGVIRPRGRVLAIPIGAGRTAAGVGRYPSPRAVPGGFWRRTRAGKLLFGHRVGGRFEALFVGVRQVTIPATYFATDAWAQATAGLDDRIRTRVRALWGRS